MYECRIHMYRQTTEKKHCVLRLCKSVILRGVHAGALRGKYSIPMTGSYIIYTNVA